MSENTTTENKPASLKAVTEFFRKPGETLKGFTAEWQSLSDKDKEDLKKGLGDGTLTY